MTQPSLDGFIAAVREYCSLAEGDQSLSPQDLWRVRELLLRLIFNMPSVERAPHGVDFDGARPDDIKYATVLKRFSGIRFNSYRVVFDPYDFEAEDEPVVSMLSDDLADIYRDLAEGLNNFENGHPDDACFDWSQSYRSHWARHALNALAAIEINRTDNYEDVEQADAHEPPPSASV